MGKLAGSSPGILCLPLCRGAPNLVLEALPDAGPGRLAAGSPNSMMCKLTPEVCGLAGLLAGCLCSLLGVLLGLGCCI